MAVSQGIQQPAAALKFVPLPSPIIVPPPSELITRIVLEGDPLPCRRCLQDGQVGETMLLISYNPFPANAKSPYAGPGPIFVHAKDCRFYLEEDGRVDEVPEQQKIRLLSLRAYDVDHMMVDQAVFKGEELLEKARLMLKAAEVQYVNVHNAGPGCFAVRVERG